MTFDDWLHDGVLIMTRGEFEEKKQEIEDALLDARSAMRYIRQTYGNLYGVGFDRVEKKLNNALVNLEVEDE